MHACICQEVYESGLLGAGEMNQQLEALAALPEDPNLISSTYMPIIPVPEDPMTSVGIRHTQGT